MSDRSLSRALGAIAAVAALSLATAGSALAMPARTDIGTPVASGNVTSGTDVAAPDQQNPIPAPVQPKVAPAPTWPLHPQTLTPVSTSSPSVGNTGFQGG